MSREIKAVLRRKIHDTDNDRISFYERLFLFVKISHISYLLPVRTPHDRRVILNGGVRPFLLYLKNLQISIEYEKVSEEDLFFVKSY